MERRMVVHSPFFVWSVLACHLLLFWIHFICKLLIRLFVNYLNFVRIHFILDGNGLVQQFQKVLHILVALDHT
jgi:hypothetical protein